MTRRVTFGAAKNVVLSFLACTLFLNFAEAREYEIDEEHSQVLFKVRHLGISTVTGRFDSFKGKFSFDPKEMAKANVEASVNATSINTNNKKRDKHLRSCDFFCTDKFASLKYTSKKIIPGKGKNFKIVGDLSMHGVSKEVTLDAEFLGEAVGYSGEKRVAFAAESSLDRKDYGLKWNDLTETGGLLVGNEVKIVLEIQGVEKEKKQKEEKKS